jgi:hypothetical protein
MAAEAERFAAYLEKRADRGDTERRLAVAETERKIAGLERQRAAKLRQPGTKYESGPPLPKLPGT